MLEGALIFSQYIWIAKIINLRVMLGDSWSITFYLKFTFLRWNVKSLIFNALLMISYPLDEQVGWLVKWMIEEWISRRADK